MKKFCPLFSVRGTFAVLFGSMLEKPEKCYTLSVWHMILCRERLGFLLSDIHEDTHPIFRYLILVSILQYFRHDFVRICFCFWGFDWNFLDTHFLRNCCLLASNTFCRKLFPKTRLFGDKLLTSLTKSVFEVKASISSTIKEIIILYCHNLQHFL